MTNKIAQAFDTIQSEVMNELVIYRPTLSKLTGSVTSAILLERIRYYSQQLKRDFFKFNDTCEHKQYRAGDSWQEEIGLTRHEFNGARKRIATKVKKGDNKAELMDVFIGDELAPIERIVLYWRDKNNLIWYRFNEQLYKAHLLKIVNPEIATSEIRHYLVNPKSGITYGVPKSGITFSTEIHKETNKELSAPKEAQGQTAKSEKQKAPDKPKAKKERNLLFDAIALESFGFKESSKISDQSGARIGMIVKYIRSLGIDVTPRMLKDFYKNYDFNNDGAVRPKDVKKFATHFDLFLQEPTTHEPQLTVVPKFDVTPEDKSAAIDAFKNKPQFGASS